VFFDVHYTGLADSVLRSCKAPTPRIVARGRPRGAKRKKLELRALANHALQNTKPAPPP
jgi:hypothetical protein